MISTLIGIGVAIVLASLLALKWELGVRRVATTTLALGVLAGLTVGLLDRAVDLDGPVRALLVAVLTISADVAILAYRFYRDPERNPPDRRDTIVSPADGEVIYVRRFESGVLPVSTKHGRDYSLSELTRTPLRSEEAVVVGIAMNFLDVHVNRAPIAGTVSARKHFAGRFGSLKRPEMVFENERATTVIEREDLQIAVVQIASRLVRQIVSYVDPGQEVELGERTGAIRLGSQVDLVLPVRPDLEIAVSVGQHVRAAETVIAELGSVSRPPELDQEWSLTTVS